MDFTRDQVATAFNRAADDLVDAIAAGDEGKRDVVNALVNAGLHYLNHPDDTLATAIEANYGVGASEVLGWCRS